MTDSSKAEKPHSDQEETESKNSKHSSSSTQADSEQQQQQQQLQQEEENQQAAQEDEESEDQRSPSVASSCSMGSANDDALANKREYNRISAAKSREKRKRTLDEMRAKVETCRKKFQKMQNENDALREEIRTLLESNQMISMTSHMSSSEETGAGSTDDSVQNNKAPKSEKDDDENCENQNFTSTSSKDKVIVERCSSLSS